MKSTRGATCRRCRGSRQELVRAGSQFENWLLTAAPCCCLYIRDSSAGWQQPRTPWGQKLLRHPKGLLLCGTLKQPPSAGSLGGPLTQVLLCRVTRGSSRVGLGTDSCPPHPHGEHFSNCVTAKNCCSLHNYLISNIPNQSLLLQGYMHLPIIKH